MDNNYSSNLDAKSQQNVASYSTRFGLIGEFVDVILPTVESKDGDALLMMMLTAMGNSFGRFAFYKDGETYHFANLFHLCIGGTACGKGTALNAVESLLWKLDEKFIDRRMFGLSSSEGLIEKLQGRTVAFVIEEEFVDVLKNFRRDGNKLSGTVRTLFDKGCGASLTKQESVSVKNVHVSAIGQITPEELERYLPETETVNGFMNRFTFSKVERGLPNPLPEDVPETVLKDLLVRFRCALDAAPSDSTRLQFDTGAEKLWRENYGKLTAVKAGNLGKVTQRGKAHVLRMALIFALLDCSRIIKANHLVSAYHAWGISVKAAKEFFSGSAEDYCREIHASGGHLTANELMRDTGIPRSSAFKLIRKLKEEGIDLSQNGRRGRAKPHAEFVTAENIDALLAN